MFDCNTSEGWQHWLDDDLNVITWCNLSCALDNHPVYHVRMTKIRKNQQTFRVDTCTNVTLSTPSHLNKIRQAVYYNVTVTLPTNIYTSSAIITTWYHAWLQIPAQRKYRTRYSGLLRTADWYLPTSVQPAVPIFVCPWSGNSRLSRNVEN